LFFLSLPALVAFQSAALWAASPASELCLAWWGDLSAVEYPPTGRDPDIVKSVEDGFRQFRETNPDALLVDVGGFVGPTCTYETVYALPPLPLYKKVGVGAVNLAEGDWLNLAVGGRVFQLPESQPVPLVTSVRTADGSQPKAVLPAAVLKAGGRTVIVFGVTSVERSPYTQDDFSVFDLDQNLEDRVKATLSPLKEQHPDASVVLLADLPRKEALALAFKVKGIDLVLVNETENPVIVEPNKWTDVDVSSINAKDNVPPPDGEVWVAGRPPAGTLAAARIRFKEDGAIRSIETEPVDLIPEERPKGNLWTWLGLKSRPPGRRILAPPSPKPIIGINLRDPRAIAEEMGFENPTIQAVRCDAPQEILDRISNKNIVSFRILHDGEETGRLYRIHLELPESNGNIIINLVLDGDGRIVRAGTKVEPVLGLRYILLSKVLAEWEGLAPKAIEISPHQYPGFDQHLRVVKDTLEFAVEIDQICR